MKWESSHSPPGAVVRIICRKSVLAEHLRRTHEPCHPFIHLFTHLAFVYRHLLGARSVLLPKSCEQERQCPLTPGGLQCGRGRLKEISNYMSKIISESDKYHEVNKKPLI